MLLFLLSVSCSTVLDESFGIDKWNITYAAVTSNVYFENTGADLLNAMLSKYLLLGWIYSFKLDTHIYAGRMEFLPV